MKHGENEFEVRLTFRWRELDSKFRFRATPGGLAGLRDPQSGQRRRVASEFVSTHCRRELDSKFQFRATSAVSRVSEMRDAVYALRPHNGKAMGSATWRQGGETSLERKRRLLPIA